MKFFKQIVVLQQHINSIRDTYKILQELKSTSWVKSDGLETQLQVDILLNQFDEDIATSIAAINVLLRWGQGVENAQPL